jgi:hypothetical protein
MSQIGLALQSGIEVQFDLPEPGVDRTEAVFVLGMRKSGSTLLNRLVIGIAKRYKLPWVDIGGGFFSHDVRANQWNDDPVVASLFKPGYLYGGFRGPYKHFQSSDVYKSGRKILLVRDPRDALVSQYFSTLKTHSLPKHAKTDGGAADQILRQREEAARLSIDDYVLLNARSFRRTLEGYAALLEDKELKVFRYEDVILNKEPWIRQILQSLGLPAHKPFIQRLVTEHDLVPAIEDANNFVRKVTPGDHTEKLRRPTIEALTMIFGDTMGPFGYRLR